MVKFNEEDTLVWALKIAASGVDVDSIISDAKRLREYLTGNDAPERPEWGEVPAMADLVAERDRARDTAVRLEQELAEMTRQYQEAAVKLSAHEMEADDLVRGVLLEVRRVGETPVTPAGRQSTRYAIHRAAQKFGVEL